MTMDSRDKKEPQEISDMGGRGKLIRKSLSESQIRNTETTYRFRHQSRRGIHENQQLSWNKIAFQPTKISL